METELWGEVEPDDRAAGLLVGSLLSSTFLLSALKHRLKRPSTHHHYQNLTAAWPTAASCKLQSNLAGRRGSLLRWEKRNWAQVLWEMNSFETSYQSPSAACAVESMVHIGADYFWSIQQQQVWGTLPPWPTPPLSRRPSAGYKEPTLPVLFLSSSSLHHSNLSSSQSARRVQLRRPAQFSLIVTLLTKRPPIFTFLITTIL